MVEWRVDYFEGIADAAAVLDVAGSLRAAAGDLPIIFTRRSIAEGGEPIAMNPGDFVKIPAHTRHRVEWTTQDEATVWLAVLEAREQARHADHPFLSQLRLHAGTRFSRAALPGGGTPGRGRGQGRGDAA